MLDAVLAGARPGSLGAQLRRQPMHPNNPPATPTQDALDRFLIPDASDLAADLAVAAPGRGARGAALDAAVCRLLDDWSLLSFVALDRGEGEEDEGGRGVADVLAQACAQDGALDVGELGRGGRGGARVAGAASYWQRLPRPQRPARPHSPPPQVDHAIQWGEDADVRVREVEGVDDAPDPLDLLDAEA